MTNILGKWKSKRIKLPKDVVMKCGCCDEPIYKYGDCPNCDEGFYSPEIKFEVTKIYRSMPQLEWTGEFTKMRHLIYYLLEVINKEEKFIRFDVKLKID